jgi:hypothetical protein
MLAAAAGAIFTITLLFQEDARGNWASGSLFSSTLIMVLAGNCAYWWWQIPRAPKLSVRGVAGRVLGLAALSVVAVTWICAASMNLVYTEPWSLIP